MARIYDTEARKERARNLGTLNGLELVFVSLTGSGNAWLDLEFYNSNSLAAILDDIHNHGVPPTAIFEVKGGVRIPAGDEPGQVQVVEVTAGAAPTQLRLRLRPIGDYSTYTLRVRYDHHFDPLFSELAFKFRPGCFNLNCAAAGGRPSARPTEPLIDYLAKDYDSFKHVLITAMRERVPDWMPTSEADLDQVLIDLIAADADELSDFQDRVVNEAYLGRLRRRISLARHARLMDYHIHQGNQASTWVVAKVSVPQVVIGAGFGVWSGRDWRGDGAVIFESAESQRWLRLLNELSLYTWGDVVTALEAGSTEADLALPSPLDPTVEADADTLVDTFRSGEFRRLAIEQKRNPETGGTSGLDKTARQVMQLREGQDAARKVYDPLAGQWLVRVSWCNEDKLKRRYCFLTACTGQPVTAGVSAFHGNLLRVTEGRLRQTVFRPPSARLAAPDDSAFLHLTEAHFEPTARWGVVCPLPEGPLAYRNTPPGGQTPPRSTLQVTVESTSLSWTEQTDLIESKADDRHFVVETDELGRSRIRFGNGIDGQAWDESEAVRCTYQTGGGTQGNVGAGTLTGFDESTFPAVSAVWNPLDVTDGRDPEEPADALRAIPEAYRKRQLRAVTLNDYVKRALEIPDVSNAYARYGWTGSWRTVRVLIDPVGTDTLTDELRLRLAGYLDAVRLIGEDIEIRGAQYVALDIKLTVCAHSDYWPEDLRQALEEEFRDSYTSDGRRGFFHPDEWTFGQPLYASQLIGRALGVQGVERVLKTSIERWVGLVGPHTSSITIAPDEVPEALVDKIDVRPWEVIRVANDPSHMEKGRILFDILGGRR